MSCMTSVTTNPKIFPVNIAEQRVITKIYCTVATCITYRDFWYTLLSQQVSTQNLSNLVCVKFDICWHIHLSMKNKHNRSSKFWFHYHTSFLLLGQRMPENTVSFISGSFCPDTVADAYFQHPHDCHGYIRCVNGRAFVYSCGTGCPNIVNDLWQSCSGTCLC